MAANKMFPSGAIENPFGDDYDEAKLDISFRIQAGQIVIQFSDQIERIRMGSGGARKLATMLTQMAAQLDKTKGGADRPAMRDATRVRPQPPPSKD